MRASRRLGREGVPGSPLPEGDNRGRPQARNFSIRDSGGWGGDVLNFYWLLVLCIFFQTSWGKKEPGKRQRLKSFTFHNQVFY